ncbi:hypothetical protein [Elizabethkingia miricola]|uniref:hypothetical protein n=1 Tax=Elizabethkingia miricola TaxID=172045 RepID=UPI0015C49578|nr:hypothetical protein [Elizabethkingia miricola]
MRLILFFMFIAIPWSTNAQSLLIGKVVDENGNAIIAKTKCPDFSNKMSKKNKKAA